MKRTLYIIKMIRKVAKIDCNNPFVAIVQLNTLKSDLAEAVMTEVITSEDYESVAKVIEETKKSLVGTLQVKGGR